MADLFFIIAPAIAFFFLVILIILFARYKVCGPSEYAVFTGLFINDMKICKSGILYPFQEVLFVDMTAFKNFALKMTSIDEDEKKEELAQFGLTIYNANIEDMQDVEEFRRMKALEGAVNESRVEVAEARQKGDIGEKEKRAQARQEIAHIEANAVAAENLANQTVSESEMNVGEGK